MIEFINGFYSYLLSEQDRINITSVSIFVLSVIKLGEFFSGGKRVAGSCLLSANDIATIISLLYAIHYSLLYSVSGIFLCRSDDIVVNASLIGPW